MVQVILTIGYYLGHGGAVAEWHCNVHQLVTGGYVASCHCLILAIFTAISTAIKQYRAGARSSLAFVLLTP